MADLIKTFDLITYKPKNLVIPPSKIALKVASNDIDPATLARIMEPVYKYLNDYRKLALNPAVEKYDKEAATIRDKDEARTVARQVNDELKKLIANLEKEAQSRIESSWNTIKKEDRAYTKFKLKIAAKVTWGVVKIGKGIAALVASAGAKADEYVKIAKSVVSIAKEIKKALDTEETAREGLRKSLEELSKKKKAGKAGKSEIAKVETAITFYGNKLTPIRQKGQTLSGKLQSLLELHDDGVEITSKQEKQINDMIEQVIEFNTNEKIGRQFQKAAQKSVADIEGKMDLTTVKGYAQKLKTAYGIAKKVFEVAADIL